MPARRPPPRRFFSQEESPAVGVTVEKISKSYGKLEVLKDLNFTVNPGEIFVLMGPSGAGKSVLLRHIIGLEAPTGGRVLINGHDAMDEDFRDHVRMALVFQAGALFNSLSVYDNLALYPREHRVGTEKQIRERVMMLLKLLSLDDTAGKFPSDLSGGMKKRVAIARALVIEPQLLLYDEPTSELDPVMSATIDEVIATIPKHYHTTTIVVSHDRDLALSIADRVGILMGGQLIHVGTPESLKNPQDQRVADFLNPRIDLENPRFRRN
ncbi:MAG: ATP-binding cassette domain-containing protein [Opitutaceae bacterium]|jgi:phospholipid/cholesterol/gamma-HCH transport system ATP-binding protein